MGEHEIYTVGHSNHAAETFLQLLRDNAIDTLVDTRSRPYSKFAPHFNPDAMKSAVTQAGIRYVFLGAELGGRPDGAEFYDAEGHALYYKVAELEGFLGAVAKLERAVAAHRVALCCAEENPSDCHRRLLVGRVLSERGMNVLHIRGDGRIEAENELLAAEAAARNGQQALFEAEEVAVWRSTRSVLQKKPHSSSLDY